MKKGKQLFPALRYLCEGVFPLLFWVLLIFGFDTPVIAVLTISAALLHELGHMIALSLGGISFGLRAHFSGFRIRERSLSYGAEIFTLAMGPGINILAFLALAPFGDALEGYASLVGRINLITAISNLLPIEGYDGYGIIERLLRRGECERGLGILRHISFSLSVVIAFLALYLLSRHNAGYWLFGLFFSVIITKMRRNL